MNTIPGQKMLSVNSSADQFTGKDLFTYKKLIICLLKHFSLNFNPASKFDFQSLIK